MAIRSSSVRFAGIDCLIPDEQPALRPALGKANSFWNPLGPAWGRGYVLMYRKDVAKLIDDGAGAFPYSLEMSDGENKIKIPKLWINKAQRLTPGKPKSDGAAYVVEIVDKRFFAARFSSTGIIRSNVFAHPHDHLGDQFYWRENPRYQADEDGDETLEDQITWLWDQVATILGEMPELPRWFLGDEGFISDRLLFHNLMLDGDNAWYALHSVLERLGVSLRYDPIADTFAWVDLTEEQEDVPNDLLKTLGHTMNAEPFTNDVTVFPEKIYVYFHKVLSQAGEEADSGRGNGTDAKRNWPMMRPYLIETVNTNDVAHEPHHVMPGTSVTLWSQIAATYDYSNTLGSQPEDAAIRLARLWVRAREQGAKRGLLKVPNLVNVKTGSLVKSVLWRNYGPSYADGGDGSQTELMNHVGLPKSPDESGIDRAPDEMWGPIDARRPQLPLYPRDSQLVQVFHTSNGVTIDPAAGTMVPSDAGGSFGGDYHSGRVMRGKESSLTNFELCWILFIDNYPASGQVPNGEFYVGRLMGGAPAGDGEEWRPVYLVHNGGLPVFRVGIDGELSGSGTAGATIFGQSVTIHNGYLGSGEHANAGDKVAVIWDATDGNWVAIGGPREDDA